ncbi:MAG: hypothetical protein ACXABY_11350 [Candidatus Thorarchaeota archaeon]|jgi:hypothetical protein
MALIVTYTNNFIEIALDGSTDFDATADLPSYGVSDAPSGLRIRKIVYVPSAAADQVIVRDGENGPAIFTAINALGTYDVLKDDYREDGKSDRGKLMIPYIHASEVTVSVVNSAFLIFEL